MTEDPIYQWAESELRRIEEDEKWEVKKKLIEERERIRIERYLNAPIMGLDGKIVGGKSLSDRKTGEP